MTLKDVAHQEIGIYYRHTPEGRKWMSDYFENYIFKEFHFDNNPYVTQMLRISRNCKTVDDTHFFAQSDDPTGVKGHRFDTVIIQKGINKEFVEKSIFPCMFGRKLEDCVFEIDPETNEIDYYFK